MSKDDDLDEFGLASCDAAADLAPSLSPSVLSAAQYAQLQAQAAAGDINFQWCSPQPCTNATRPLASPENAGMTVFNTDSNEMEVSDGVSWRDSSGVIT